MKYYVLILAIVLSFRTYASDEVVEYSPATTKIGWDLHRVIVDYDFKGMFQQAWQDLYYVITVMRPSVGYVCAKALLQGNNGYCWAGVIKNYPEFAKSVIRIGNRVKRIQGTYEIMQQLHALGYEQDLLSNIDTQFLQELEKKPEMHEVFKLMSFKKSVNAQEEQAIYKNDVRYFLDYQHDKNPQHKKIIFIDDWQPNLEIAKNVAGIVCIHFKNPAQLKQDLHKLGILLD